MTARVGRSIPTRPLERQAEEQFHLGRPSCENRASVPGMGGSDRGRGLFRNPGEAFRCRRGSSFVHSDWGSCSDPHRRRCRLYRCALGTRWRGGRCGPNGEGVDVPLEGCGAPPPRGCRRPLLLVGAFGEASGSAPPLDSGVPSTGDGKTKLIISSNFGKTMFIATWKDHAHWDETRCT